MSARSVCAALLLSATLILSNCSPIELCSCDFAVYNEQGVRLPYRIAGVFGVMGNTVSYPKKFGQRMSPNKVVLTGPGDPIELTLGDFPCEGHRTFQIPHQGEAAVRSLSGSLTGCPFQHDWWLRLVPMFGSSGQNAAMYTTPDDEGHFEFAGQLIRGMHVLIIGRDATPLATLTLTPAQMQSGALATISLDGKCL